MPNGHPKDLFLFGITVSTSAITVVTLKLALENKYASLPLRVDISIQLLITHLLVQHMDHLPPCGVLGQPRRVLLLHQLLRRHSTLPKLGQSYLLGILYVPLAPRVRIAAFAFIYKLVQS